MLTLVLWMAIIYLCPHDWVMEFSYPILIEISFYSNIICMSTDVEDILNFANQFHEYLFEQKPKSSFSVFVCQLFGDFFFSNTSAIFSLGKKKKKKEGERSPLFCYVAALSECLHW